MNHPFFLRLSIVLLVSVLGFNAFVASGNAQDPVSNPPPAESTPSPAPEPTDEESPSVLSRINQAIFTVLFFDLSFGTIQIDKVDQEGNPVLDEAGTVEQSTIEVPFLIIFLLFGGIFFSLYYRWISLRGFKHSIDVIRGKFDKEDDVGEITHFRALTSALSATVGLGNIAGVAVAIQLGGPGAVFWMWLTALVGMASKFSSCTLSQLFRQVNKDGSISGGPMYYLDLGLRKKGPGWAIFGKILAVMFAFMVMGGAVGGGNMFQANQTVEAITDTFNLDAELSLSKAAYDELLITYTDHRAILESNSKMIDGTVHIHLGDLSVAEQQAMGEDLVELKAQAGVGAQWGIGIVLAIFAGVVILGGIKRIGAATSKIVPLMCGIYVLASLFIIIKHFDKLPETFGLIFQMAFTKNAFYGGFVGVLIWGIKRAAFSNEAGLGSAAIAHAAAKTDEPVREGMVAMIGPFIDTIIVCTMTALVVIITGAWVDPTIPQSAGVSLTTAAFGSVITWFPYVLTGCIALFAYSTMISWCYYGERGWIYILDHFGKDEESGGLGLKTVSIFRLIFVACIIVGAIHPLSDVLDFSDAMILSMAFPNILGSIFLAPFVLERVNDYWGRYRRGEMTPVSSPHWKQND